MQGPGGQLAHGVRGGGGGKGGAPWPPLSLLWSRGLWWSSLSQLLHLGTRHAALMLSPFVLTQRTHMQCWSPPALAGGRRERLAHPSMPLPPLRPHACSSSTCVPDPPTPTFPPPPF